MFLLVQLPPLKPTQTLQVDAESSERTASEGISLSKTREKSMQNHVFPHERSPYMTTWARWTVAAGPRLRSQKAESKQGMKRSERRRLGISREFLPAMRGARLVHSELLRLLEPSYRPLVVCWDRCVEREIKRGARALIVLLSSVGSLAVARVL